MAVAAASFRAKLAGQPSPAGERPARALAGYRRTAGDRGRGQARPFGFSDLAAVLATCHRPRRRGRGVESDQVALERGRLDAVIAGLLFMAGMQRSEVSALRWADVADSTDGDGMLVNRAPEQNQAHYSAGAAAERGAVRRRAQTARRLARWAVRSGYEVVLNVGCAEGYYAVGLARRMPAVRVHAFDLDPRAREACAGLAEKAGVADRVDVRGEFRPDDVAACASRRVLLLCDIEGAEKELLDPSAAPALRGVDLIVECHDGAAKVLMDRFAPSHDVTAVVDDGLRRLEDAPAWFRQLAHLDQLLATWEWRGEATPWLVMTARAPRA